MTTETKKGLDTRTLRQLELFARWLDTHNEAPTWSLDRRCFLGKHISDGPGGPGARVPAILVKHDLVRVEKLGRALSKCRLTAKGLACLHRMPANVHDAMETLDAILAVSKNRDWHLLLQRREVLKTIRSGLRQDVTTEELAWAWLTDEVLSWAAYDIAEGLVNPALVDWIRPHVPATVLEARIDRWRQAIARTQNITSQLAQGSH